MAALLNVSSLTNATSDFITIHGWSDSYYILSYYFKLIFYLKDVADLSPFSPTFIPSMAPKLSSTKINKKYFILIITVILSVYCLVGLAVAAYCFRSYLGLHPYVLKTKAKGVIDSNINLSEIIFEEQN
jgi:hypothetical protein